MFRGLEFRACGSGHRALVCGVSDVRVSRRPSELRQGLGFVLRILGIGARWLWIKQPRYT